MTLKDFILKTKAMLPGEEDRTPVLDWIEFACEMAEEFQGELTLEDQLEEIYLPLAYVKNNFSPDTLRKSLRTVVVSNEIVQAAMYMEAGYPPEQVAELAANGRFEDGDRIRSGNQVGAFTLVEISDAKGGFFLAESETTELIAYEVRRACRLAADSDKSIAEMLCNRRISDLRIKAITDVEQQAVLVHNFQHNTAIGSYMMYWPKDDTLHVRACPALEPDEDEEYSDEYETESPDEYDGCERGLQP